MRSAKLKLLIISSEPLYPGYTIGSTFELSQAQIISSFSAVAILSVSPQTTLLPVLKEKMGLSKGRVGHVMPGFSVFLRSFFGGHGTARKHQIEGVEVFEGLNVAIKSSPEFNTGLSSWVKAGWAAYEKYVSENGPPDLIHAHGRFLNAGVLALEIFKKHKIKYIYTEHSTFYQRGIAPIESKGVLSNVIQNAGASTFVSVGLLRKVEEFLGENLEHALIARNALDRLFESPVNRTSRNAESPFLVCIASLDEKKGIDVLIRAYNQTFKKDRPKLYICGEGKMRESLSQLIDSFGLKEEIYLLGNQSKKEIINLLDNCAYFVLPSIVETFGVVVIEALARGCPVVATRSGGPEFILDESNSILTEPGDIEGLSGALIKMMDSMSRFDRNKIRENALGRFGSAAFAEEISRIYNIVLQ